jgi:hypothetical protein
VPGLGIALSKRGAGRMSKPLALVMLIVAGVSLSGCDRAARGEVVLQWKEGRDRDCVYRAADGWLAQGSNPRELHAAEFPIVEGTQAAGCG